MEGIDRRAAEAFFAKKVPGSQRSEGSRHTAYRIFSPSGKLLLGNLTMSRGASGSEITLRNLKGLATDMGLSLDGFVEASNCRIRPEVVVLCVVARVLEDAQMMHSLDPISFDGSLIRALGNALNEWITMLRPDARKLTAKEAKELARCQRRLSVLVPDKSIGELAKVYAVRASSLGHA